MTRYAFLARKVDQTAALLALPEVAWTAFATTLSAAIAAKNIALSRRLDTSGQEGSSGPHTPTRKAQVRG